MGTHDFPVDPYHLGKFADPDAPTVPDLPAYPPEWPAPPVSARPLDLFEQALDRFRRLSFGARFVCVGCVALVTFCLVSPYVDVAVETALGQVISGGTSSAAPGSAVTNPPGSTHTTKRHSSTMSVSRRQDGALTWSTSTAVLSPIPQANAHANAHAKPHGHTQLDAAAAQHQDHGHGHHGGHGG